jgi:hypothetical protein
MRFDPERVIRNAQALSRPRVAWTLGEDRAAHDMAALFNRAGLRIDLVTASSFNPPARLLVILLLGWCWLGTVGVMPGASWETRLTVAGAIVMVLFVAYVAVVVRHGGSDIVLPSRHVIGISPIDAPRPVRLVLMSRLVTPGPRWQTVWHASFLVVFVVLGMGVLALQLDGTPRVLHRAGPALFAGQWLALLLLIVGPWRQPAPASRGDNRTGLAMLVELAETWPKGLVDRVETWFVATPDPVKMSRDIANRLGDRPTLAIALDTPGVGGELAVAGRGMAASLALEAARGLWIPHRQIRRAGRELGLPAFRRIGLPGVALCGASGDLPIEPASLGATAQLVTEVALRWARQHANAEAQGESLARSSQKPG